jgi:hypothetical protein
MHAIYIRIVRDLRSCVHVFSFLPSTPEEDACGCESGNDNYPEDTDSGLETCFVCDGDWMNGCTAIGRCCCTRTR